MITISLRLPGASELVLGAQRQAKGIHRTLGLLGQVADEPEPMKPKRLPPSALASPAIAEGTCSV